MVVRATGEPQMEVVRAHTANMRSTPLFEVTARIEVEVQMLAGFGASMEDFGEGFRRRDRTRVEVYDEWAYIRTTVFSIVADRIEAQR